RHDQRAVLAPHLLPRGLHGRERRDPGETLPETLDDGDDGRAFASLAQATRPARAVRAGPAPRDRGRGDAPAPLPRGRARDDPPDEGVRAPEALVGARRRPPADPDRPLDVPAAGGPP